MRTVALGEVAAIERKGVDPSSVPPDTMYLGLEHIERGGRIIGHGTVAGAELASTKFRFSTDHVLFGKLRPNLGKISRPNFEGVCSTDILPIRPGKELDRAYLAHYLTQPRMVAFASSRTSGANLPRLSPTVLAQFPIPLPPLAEQRRIAAILDRADTLRNQRHQGIRQIATLVPAIFHSMFGPLTDARWDEVPLRQVITTIESGTSLNCENRPAADHESGILKLGAVTYGEFRAWENKAYLGSTSALEKNEVRPGDVLMTRKNTRDLVGAVALVEDVRQGLLLPDLVFRLRLDEVQLNPNYFQALMMHPITRHRVRNLSGGSAASMPNISQARLSGLILAIPPIKLQELFAHKARGVSQQRAASESALAFVDDLFNAAKSQILRGGKL